ncbi:arsenate reductase (glutaredoxin) [Gilvimarinus agarilyticus]|uniref:arsenate reductase (glutaredoxin) n=1 Tax=Gilvimarinus sp. 2_MG-2023 TaxID=3062666 RepID=UPI001C082AEC|nr:arsenate reductase (glutaredoxin) [Gilvimarinus sp. 2_MG-2023]MBU2887391.1 arsenate reductase (glutaredoxin) [Gilvimarinus agarilyticus]MDO6572050.1 arsenate reductase (glutaredoxin) [Gilvimarinus sp. 2_MG-2023]
MQLYHNPRCSKSRQALSLLEERSVSPQIIKYLDETPSVSELAEVIKKLGITPRELLRKGEAAYKELNLADPALSDQHIIQAMQQNPKLIERPIAIVGNKAVIGRPPENVLELL